MSEQVAIGKRFTIVIPKPIRKKLGLKEGQGLLIRVEETKLVLEPLPGDPYDVLKRIIGEPYEERRDEKKAERWLKSHARR